MLRFWITLIPFCIFASAQVHIPHDSAVTQQAFKYVHGDLTFATASQIDISKEPWTSKYGPQNDLGYSGPLSFSHFDYKRCLEDASVPFDIGIIGFPFDTTTSYRPGARFGPSAIRSGSRRQSLGKGRGYTLAWGSSPSDYGSSLLDCGDVPISAYDNAKAIDQMEAAYSTLLSRPVFGGTSEVYKEKTRTFSRDGKEHPRIVTLGGDHTIVLPILRALNKVYGPVSVIHFDAHLDTWPPRGTTVQEGITHGSFFAVAAEEGLLTNTSIHAGIRCKMFGIEDMEHDDTVGFQVISTEDIDDYGIKRVIEKIRQRIGNQPVYLSLDIDVVDPGQAPATGTPEVGGWTTREVKRILRGLSGLNFVGADIVEVAPAYDNADITGIAAADIVHDFLSMMLVDGPPEPHVGPFSKIDLLL
ncbi:arginase family-domain-containing protein [Lentinula aciculospora]|uniref:Arginase family-domain-containing protein n=1 Tax=Lentinula aciculospora TaxID=153920 RepID=A0A9W9AWD7_9AGAR|nr:arginase family-domain-containing protein [Lentinula aciculospora]